MSRVDWPALRAAAVEVMHRAYAPYSRFPVGAAGLVDDGRVVFGCNVENAAYGVVLCAECGMVSQLHATGGGRLIAMACVDADGEPLLPCGRCRQLLWENGGPAMLVDSKSGPLTMDYLLPHGFSGDDLAAVAFPSIESAFAEPDPGDDWPKRPPSRHVRKKAAEPEEPEQPKTRATKKLSLRDLDADEPATDSPRGRKKGGSTAKGASALAAKATATPASRVSGTVSGGAASGGAKGTAASGGVSGSAASAGTASGRSAKGGAASGGAKGTAASGGVSSSAASAGTAKGGAASGGAASGRTAKSAKASGGSVEGGTGSGGAAKKGGAKGAAGQGMVEEDSAGRRGRAGAGKARGKGAAR